MAATVVPPLRQPYPLSRPLRIKCAGALYPLSCLHQHLHTLEFSCLCATRHLPSELGMRTEGGHRWRRMTRWMRFASSPHPTGTTRTLSDNEMSKVAYEGDFYGWTQEQASLLRTGRLAELDVEHLIEEIESMGRSERRQMTNRFELLLMHLLKWQYQPDRREIDGKSWLRTIHEQRRKIPKLIRDNPSLKSLLGECVEDAYEEARLRQAMKPACWLQCSRSCVRIRWSRSLILSFCRKHRGQVLSFARSAVSVHSPPGNG